MVSHSKKTMFMARTPLRVTFTGGGTDLPDFYTEHGPGICISAAIDKYIYVMVNKKFDNKIRLSYSRTEIVDSVDDLKHPSVREALRLLELDGGIEIVSISDIPSTGTGLGSSSSFLVSLLNALHAYKGEHASAKLLSEEAVKIEREILGEPGGKQDQYIAAYGGLRILKFLNNGSVSVSPIIAKSENYEMLHDHLLLMYTGKSRKSTDIHRSQSETMNSNIAKYEKMRNLSLQFPRKLSEGNIPEIAKLLSTNWKLKSSLADGITDPWIDENYRLAIKAGAMGGKLIGAGGGGFFLFVVPPEKRESIINALPELRVEPFNFEFMGSSIIYVGE